MRSTMNKIKILRKIEFTGAIDSNVRCSLRHYPDEIEKQQVIYMDMVNVFSTPHTGHRRRGF